MKVNAIKGTDHKKKVSEAIRKVGKKKERKKDA